MPVLRHIFSLLWLAALLWPAAAAATTLETLVMPGKVSQAHAKYEEDCGKCHEPFSKKSQRRLCLECHKDTAGDIRQQIGFHGRNATIRTVECKQCHSEHLGRNADIIQFNKDLLDHQNTDFPLRGGHGKLACAACHKANTPYRKASTRCHVCHEAKDVHQGKLGQDCAKCHQETNWRQTSFNHAKTAYPLTGKHGEVSCDLCHVGHRYKGVSHQCIDCHRINDVHNGRYGPKCQSCHSTKGWKGFNFDHDRETKFPLRGKHKDTRCNNCHKSDYKIKLNTQCHACHKEQDIHKGLYGQQCGSCHGEAAWRDHSFDHKKFTATACYDCHKLDDEHKGRYGKKCESCHNVKGWRDDNFDHDRKTKFPLRGKHKEMQCQLCHKGDASKERDKIECRLCHGLDDVHKGNYGQRCEICHNEKKWKEYGFDHDSKTKYPLRGKHKQIRCQLCHAGDVTKERGKTECVQCHEKVDVHKGKEGKQCQRCHNEQGWREKVAFDHDMTRFPLAGLHATTPCEECHVNADYRGTKANCNACHVRKDVHKGRLGPKCEQCHNPNSWKFWQFDHDTQTKYRLEGSHQKISCGACHKAVVQDKIKLAKECDACHRNDDIHAGNFGRQCERCHNVRSFKEITLRP